MRIYEREYDNPLNKDGSEKESVYLGNFKILEVLSKSCYDSLMIGKKGNKIYLITEYEVCGCNGGSKFIIRELKTLQERLR